MAECVLKTYRCLRGPEGGGPLCGCLALPSPPRLASAKCNVQSAMCKVQSALHHLSMTRPNWLLSLLALRLTDGSFKGGHVLSISASSPPEPSVHNLEPDVSECNEQQNTHKRRRNSTHASPNPLPHQNDGSNHPGSSGASVRLERPPGRSSAAHPLLRFAERPPLQRAMRIETLQQTCQRASSLEAPLSSAF